jgi:hypothetical protein
MKPLLFVLLLVTTMANAQLQRPTPARPEKPIKDSSEYYSAQLMNMQRAVMDSLRKSEAYQGVETQLNHYKRPGNNYGSLVLFLDVAHTDFGAFNSSIAQSGFPAMAALSPRIGFGTSIKNNWAIIDFYYVAVGLNAVSKKGEEKIKTSFSSLFEVDLGYDFVNSRSISIYPYGGLSLRIASLRYVKPEIANPNYTNITDIITNQQSISSGSFNVGYQAGLGFDVVTTRTDNNAAAFILFVKAGTTGAIGKERYKISGMRYEPGIKRGDWVITIGCKFAGR